MTTMKEHFQDPKILGPLVRADDDKAVAYVIGVLKRNNGNAGKTAKDLGISRPTLYLWREASDKLRAGLDEHGEGKTLKSAQAVRIAAAKERRRAERKGKKRAHKAP